MEPSGRSEGRDLVCSESLSQHASFPHACHDDISHDMMQWEALARAGILLLGLSTSKSVSEINHFSLQDTSDILLWKRKLMK